MQCQYYHYDSRHGLSKTCKKDATQEIEGKHYCNIHAGGVKRSLAAYIRADTKRREVNDRMKEWSSLLQGDDIEYSNVNFYDGTITIRIDAFLELIGRKRTNNGE